MPQIRLHQVRCAVKLEAGVGVLPSTVQYRPCSYAEEDDFQGLFHFWVSPCRQEERSAPVFFRLHCTPRRPFFCCLRLPRCLAACHVRARRVCANCRYIRILLVYAVYGSALTAFVALAVLKFRVQWGVLAVCERLLCVSPVCE